MWNTSFAAKLILPSILKLSEALSKIFHPYQHHGAFRGCRLPVVVQKRIAMVAIFLQVFKSTSTLTPFIIAFTRLVYNRKGR